MTLTPKTTTPIEDRAAWQIHHAARKEATDKGACFRCSTELAFAAVELARGVTGLFPAKVCAKCKAKGIGQP